MRKTIILFILIPLLYSLFLINNNSFISSRHSDTGIVSGESEVELNLDHEIYRPEVKILGEKYLPKARDLTDYEPVLSKNAANLVLPDCQAAALEAGNGFLLYKKNHNKTTPIASITKLATALVFLDHNPGWDSVYEVKNEDIIKGGRIYLRPGDKIKVKDLFYLSLVGSANTATKALVSSTGMSQPVFVMKMNHKTRLMGLKDTIFKDPTGISPGNVSTPEETAMLAKAAFENTQIRKATLTKNYSFITNKGSAITVNNTDLLLDHFPENGVRIIGGKTGFTKTAGYCFVGLFENKEGKRIIVSVLKSDSYNKRFSLTKDILDWVFASYQWK